VITVAIGGVLRWADAPLAQTGFGVASLEVATSPEQSALIIGLILLYGLAALASFFLMWLVQGRAARA
jgi:hypothetical protein